MMKISSISIYNFRGIQHFECSDLSQLNVFAGVNGAGKSTILNAISILLSWLIARIRNPKGRGQVVSDKDITIGADYCLLRLTLDDGTSWQLYKQRANVRKQPESKTEMAEMNGLANQIAEQITTDLSSDIPLIDAYGVNRVVDKTPMRVRKAHRLNQLDALSVDSSNSVNFHDFFIWFREMEDIENEHMRNTGILVPDKKLQAIRNTISMLFKGYSNFKVQRNPKAFIISKNDVKLNFNQLSDGEKSYIALVVDIARKMAMTHPTLENPLEGKGIVLIDEIDLHLHPSWQREVIGNLQAVFPNVQFFITTHSPHVVSCVNLNQGDKLFVIEQGTSTDSYGNQFGKESDRVLDDIFQMSSLRNPIVQEHIDKVWECLRNKDYQSNTYQKEMEWLKERIDNADAEFVKINLEVALLKKQNSNATH